MPKKFLLPYLFFIACFDLSAQISTSCTIRSVLQEVRSITNNKARVLVAFDLDETLIEPDNDNHYGSDMWLEARIEHACKKYGLSVKTAWDFILPFYFEIQQNPHFKVRLVEGKETLSVVQALQQETDKVIGLTARSFPIEDVTIRLLENTGLSFVRSGYFDSFGESEKIFMFDGVPGGFKLTGEASGADDS